MDSRGLSVLGHVDVPVWPNIIIEGSMQAMTATSLEGEELQPFESLTEQYFYIGGRYLVLQDPALATYVGAGYKRFNRQYRDGKNPAETENYDLMGHGPYANITVESHPTESLYLRGEAGLSWRGAFSKDDDALDHGRISTARGKVRYNVWESLSLQGTIVRNFVELGDSTLVGTWYGLGVVYQF